MSKWKGRNIVIFCLLLASTGFWSYGYLRANYEYKNDPEWCSFVCMDTYRKLNPISAHGYMFYIRNMTDYEEREKKRMNYFDTEEGKAAKMKIFKEWAKRRRANNLHEL